MIDAEVMVHWRDRWRHRIVDPVRERSDPWALPLIVRVERADPPAHGDALHAAARAVLLMLAHPKSGPEGPWYPPLERWSSGWIRKVVRRARGVRWSDVVAMPGITAEHHGAYVRALLPHAVSDPPIPVAKLQVSGLTLPDDLTEPTDADVDDTTAPNESTLVIALAPGLSLSTGKAAAQVAHAAQLAALQLEPNTVRAWLRAGVPLRLTPVGRATWARLLAMDSGVAVVHDAGFTEVEPGTATCVAIFDRLSR